jgi:broad specificity phosphatase PhoE
VPVLFPHVKYLHIEHIGYSLNPPGGETFDALHERAHVFAGGLLDRHSSKRIVVFSHQNFMQQLHGVLRGMDPYESLEHDVLNCELNEFKLGADRELMAHRRELLVPSAVEHSSF